MHHFRTLNTPSHFQYLNRIDKHSPNFHHFDSDAEISVILKLAYPELNYHSKDKKKKKSASKIFHSSGKLILQSWTTVTKNFKVQWGLSFWDLLAWRYKYSNHHLSVALEGHCLPPVLFSHCNWRLGWWSSDSNLLLRYSALFLHKFLWTTFQGQKRLVLESICKFYTAKDDANRGRSIMIDR